jgi:TPR repeat protein
MRNLIKAGIAGVVLALGLAASVAAGPLEDGLAAYSRGDYATAMRLWRPLADRGEADAQFDLESCTKTVRACRRIMRPH